MSKYYVLSNLKHDGKQYKKGDYVELPEDRGAQLERDGVVTSNETVSKPVDQVEEYIQAPEQTEDTIQAPEQAEENAQANAQAGGGGGDDSGQNVEEAQDPAANL